MYSKLRESGCNLDVSDPVSEELLGQYEKELNISFGDEYKEFLKEFGCLSVEYLEFYGICGNNTSAPSSIFMTKKMQEDLDFFPNNLVVIFEEGDGTFYCVDYEDRIHRCSYHDCIRLDEKFSEFILARVKELNC